MRFLARALDPGIAPAGREPDEKSETAQLARLTLDDLGEALAYMRAGLLRDVERHDPTTHGLRARRHADLDAAALEAASQIMERYGGRQRRFLQDISHDLRSPLNSILFLADALRSEHSGPLNEVQTRQVEVLFMAAVTLVKMVNDVIDFARLGTDAPLVATRTPFSLESVLTDVNGLVGPVVAHNGVDLNLEMRAAGLRSGDAQVVNRVLLNLVSNAVQALPEGGRIDVVFEEMGDGGLRLEVRDTGTEAPIEKIRAVLESDDPDHLAGETRGWTHGLGLSISARLVRAAGGSITVDRAADGGTVFVVRLPFPSL
ncbi:MAG: HAMP domain-containing sensor histidine kinase [Gemmatimonadota bacterium]